MTAWREKVLKKYLLQSHLTLTHLGGFDDWHKANPATYMRTDNPSVDTNLVPGGALLASAGKLTVKDIEDHNPDLAKAYKEDMKRGSKVPAQFLQAMSVQAHIEDNKKKKASLKLKRRQPNRLSSSSPEPTSPSQSPPPKRSKQDLDADWGMQVQVSGDDSDGDDDQGDAGNVSDLTDDSEQPPDPSGMHRKVDMHRSLLCMSSSIHTASLQPPPNVGSSLKAPCSMLYISPIHSRTPPWRTQKTNHQSLRKGKCGRKCPEGTCTRQTR